LRQRLRFFLLPWMQAELFQFFTESETRQPKPSRGFGLVALGEQDGLRVDLAFSFGQDLGVRYQFCILAVLVGLSVLNEVADLPHLWWGCPIARLPLRATHGRRSTEVWSRKLQDAPRPQCVAF
jgi:hypothetical protein